MSSAAAVSLLVTPLALTALSPVHASPDGDLVISEVYGAGHHADNPYNADFIELYNPTDGPINLSGLSLQYRSASSTAAASGSNLVVLPDVDVAAGDYYLVSGAGSDGGTSPPAPDLEASFNASGSSGQVFLAGTASGFIPEADASGSVTDSRVVDFLGYGTANRFETAASPGANNLSVARDLTRIQPDTDDNSADFAVAAPDPDSSGHGGGEPDPGPQQLEISEIQGTGAQTPVSGQQVTTRGVVTAAYPTGGLNGFYLQTPGSGGQLDLADHNASDGIFVYRGSRTKITARPGDYVEVTGTAGEYAGATQITAFDDSVTLLDEEAAPVAPLVSDWPASDEHKESLEGMLFAPQGRFTITDNYRTNRFGELGLAVGDTPLIQPTQVARPGTRKAAAVAADNEARAIVLDDGSSTNFTAAYAQVDQTPPYISNSQPFRIGATGTFDDDLILTEGGSPSSPTYRFQPLTHVVGPGNATSPITFPDTRTEAPDSAHVAAEGRPKLTVASFNVLNYFTTLGDPDDDNTSEFGCSPYRDRDGDGNNVRSGCDQRGAWDPEDLARQQAKIVHAINSLDADVVGLMEIENSVALGEEPDEALESLVAALNAAAGAGVWGANPSSGDLPPVAQQDVITNALIYRTDTVERVGAAHALGDQSEGDGSETDEPFANAREPIGQVFVPKRGGQPVLVVVNHFKSKGSVGPFPGDTDDGSGQGNSNESRIRQAEALADWVPEIQAEEQVDNVLLLGDFNAYAMEDPMSLLYSEGYTNLAWAAGLDEYSYSFSGRSGSLDHVLANEAALTAFTGADVWDINADEPVALEYSRWNYHATDFHADGPFRSSDHDPVVIGLSPKRSSKQHR